MRRKILSTLLALCMLTAFVPVAARAYYGTQYDDWLYYEVNENGDGITITGCDSNASGEIVIPDEIDNLPVTIIDDYVFNGCEKLTKITLPQNLTYIGECAFCGCSAWEGELTIPEGVASISDSAFMDCKKLTKITLPQNLTYIGDYAFCQCYAWEGELTIPNGVTSINKHAFKSCEKLEKITLPQNLTFIGDGAFCQCYAWEGELTIPDSVTSIGEDAFMSCEKLTKITLPQNLTYIGDYAFCQCYAWEGELTIPDGVTSIGEEAFYFCKLLTSVYIPKNVEHIGNDAFYACYELEQINVAPNNTFFISQDGILFNSDKTVLIKYPEGKNSGESYSVPNGVQELPPHAMANCSDMSGIVILPETLETIGEEAFRNCDNLTEITIPAGVTTIGSNPFFTCNRLKEIHVSENNHNFCDDNGVLFDKNKTSLIVYPSSKPYSQYSIPDTVTNISYGAFDSCEYLTSMSIPDNVTSIGTWTFAYCQKLASVTIPNSVESIDEDVFRNCRALQNITIPTSVTSIGSNAFNGCTALTDVYYGGSETDWENIDIKTTNKPLTSARIHYNYVITDPDTYAISNIQAASGGVELTVQSNKPVSGEQIVIVAYYDADGAFLNCETQPITYSETEQTISFNGNENAISIKAFIWNVLDCMMPASETAVAEITSN